MKSALYLRSQETPTFSLSSAGPRLLGTVRQVGTPSLGNSHCVSSTYATMIARNIHRLFNRTLLVE
jgi:hypothetical protein